MAIKPILQFRNTDSTLDLNTTQARIVDRAIFDGGSLTLSGVALQVSIAPFIATGYDGIVAVSDATETRSVPAPAAAGPDRVSYLILHLEYRSLTTPIYNLQVVPETTWTTSVSRNYFVTFAKFTIPFGATSLTDPGVSVDYSVGDWADKLGKTGWRQPVATAASLPTTQNRDGDVRIAFDTRFAYQWNASTSAWSPIGGAVDLSEVASRNAESKYQFHRVTSGSGFLNEIPQNLATSPTGPGATVAGDGVRSTTIPVQFPFIPINSVANTANLPGCHYLVNGHFVKTHATSLTFPAAPGVGERFDLLILEVWREALAVPSTETYDDEGSIAQPFTVLRTALENMTEQGAALASSFDLSEMEAYSSTSFSVTRYQYRVVQGVNVSVLTDTGSVAASINNFDGNAFSLGTNADQKTWQAVSATSIDGYSWALPLVVVRRTSDELAGPPYIETFRADDERYVFDVAPRAELGMGLFELEEAVRLNHAQTAIRLASQRPAGFILGTDTEITINDGELVFPFSQLFLQGRTVTVSGTATLPAPPGSGGRTDVVILEVFQTVYNPNTIAGSAAVEFTSRDRMGPHAVAWCGRFRTISLPLNSLETTPEAAMTATGVYTPFPTEPYLWSRTSDPLVGEDPVYPVYAVPMALVHRRNTGVYALTALGQNGANRSALPGLPNQAATLPYRYEVLDCRARSVIEPEELQHILDESFDQLIDGKLRTGMSIHPFATNAAGSQLLHVDLLSAVAVAGTNQVPNPPNGMQTVWAESDEAELFTWTFLNMDVDASDPTGTFTWTAATNKLGISLPTGYTLSLNPQQPAQPYGPQVWAAYSLDGTGVDQRPVPMTPVYFTGGAPLGWFIDGDPITPTPMRQTEVTLTLDVGVAYTEAQARVVVGVWAVKRNHEAGRSSVTNSYQQNRGLFAVPDNVRRIEYSLTGVAPFTRAWVGVPLNVIDVPVVGDALVIDRATLFASGSISTEIASVAANLNVWAVADIQLDTTSSIDKVRYIQFTDDAGALPQFSRTRIEFSPASVPANTTARVTLVCTGDLVDRWFELDAGSKQIRGPYQIFSNQFSTTASAQHLSNEVGGVNRISGWTDCGIGVWGAMAASNSQSSAGKTGGLTVNHFSYDFSFYAAGTANAAWEIWMNSVDRDSTRNISIGQTVGLQRGIDVTTGSLMNIGAHNGLFSAKYEYTAGAVGNHNSVMVAPGRAPLPSGAAVRVYYEYTPYQGITSGLETKINGIVEGVADQLVFTNGTNRPWIDYRVLATSMIRYAQSFAPPGVYSSFASVGADMGLLYSKGRVSDRGFLSASDGPTQGTQFVVDDLARPYRTADRPPVAISQRLPFPTKAANGASVGTRYSPEGYLSGSVFLDAPIMRHISPGTGYAKSEVSPWNLHYSDLSTDELVWDAPVVGKTLYFPLPLAVGEHLAGITIETENGGTAGYVIGVIATKNRTTGVVTASSESFNLFSATPLNTRQLFEVSLIPIAPLSATPTTELFLQLLSVVSDVKIGHITISVVPNQIFAGGSNVTARRYSYNDVELGVGETLKKGTRIEVPTTWSSELASYESVFVSNGRQDYTNSPPRGRALVSTLLGSTSYGAGGLLGYVPGGDSLSPVSFSSSAVPTYAGRETAPRFNSKPRAVLTGATAPDVSVGTALAYIVRNDEDVMYMGVSTGYSNVSAGTATVRAGQAVDAFVPVGRPVFRRS